MFGTLKFALDNPIKTICDRRTRKARWSNHTLKKKNFALSKLMYEAERVLLAKQNALLKFLSHAEQKS